MTRSSPSWTNEETKLAEEFYATLSPADFLEQVGRTKQAAKAHLNYLKKPGVREKMAARSAAIRRKQEDWLAKASARQLAASTPPEVIKDAVHRLTAPRSTTAWICGDPAPGRSALERLT